jgi:glutathione S-transferase
MPGFHGFAVRRAGSPRTSVPVLQVDGKVIGDSTDILVWADAHAPAERKIYPPEARLRADVDATEHDFDEGLGPHLRRVVYFHLLPRRSVVISLCDVNTPRWQGVALRAGFPVLRALMRRSMRIDERTAARSLDEVRRTFDAIEKRLGDGRRYLVGDRFTAADLTFAALVGPAVQPEEHPVRFPDASELPTEAAALLRETQERPAGQFVKRMYKEHRA